MVEFSLKELGPELNEQSGRSYVGLGRVERECLDPSVCHKADL